MPDTVSPKPTQIRWKTHVRLSALHAARTVGSGHVCIDAATQRQLSVLVSELNQRLVSQSVNVARFWETLICETAMRKDSRGKESGSKSGIDTDQRSLCVSALTSGRISEFQIEQTAITVSRAIRDCQQAFTSRFPKLVDQLELRGKPLRQSWDTYGPGLLRSASRIIWGGDPPSDWWPASCDGYLVQPMRGGDGEAIGTTGFWIEAMLTDADPALPEVLRVAYLLTRVAIDRHVRDRSGDTMSLLPWREAAVVVVLKAAADLDLVPAIDLPIENAVARWLRGDVWVADVLRAWADQWQQTGAAMPVALKALDRMMESHRAGLASEVEMPGIDLLDDDMLRELGLQDDS
ncbi:MAG: hypothetical protein AAF989_03965 [Planctomycetota bacterium]